MDARHVRGACQRWAVGHSWWVDTFALRIGIDNVFTKVGIMIGIAVERWPASVQIGVADWLFETFGEPSDTTWLVENDHDLQTLCVSAEIYTMYQLKWGS